MSMKPEAVNFVPGRISVVDNKHNPKDAPKNVIEFSFNPTKLTISAKANWDQPAQNGKPKSSNPTFKGSDPRMLTIDFVLDAWERDKTDDLQKQLDTLQAWITPTEKSAGNSKPHPPAVQLDWGGPRWFRAYVMSVDITITMFDTKGRPQRAAVKLTMKEIPKPGKEQNQNPTSGSRVGHGSHLVVEGESLATIAHRVYEKPSYWRGIAHANNIADPSRVRPGTRIYLPPIEDVAAVSR